jgi:hypothetical protein
VVPAHLAQHAVLERLDAEAEAVDAEVPEAPIAIDVEVARVGLESDLGVPPPKYSVSADPGSARSAL